jgi:DNA-directed RNA polymerase specialized sigma24 family protein
MAWEIWSSVVSDVTKVSPLMDAVNRTPLNQQGDLFDIGHTLLEDRVPIEQRYDKIHRTAWYQEQLCSMTSVRRDGRKLASEEIDDLRDATVDRMYRSFDRISAKYDYQRPEKVFGYLKTVLRNKVTDAYRCEIAPRYRLKTELWGHNVTVFPCTRLPGLVDQLDTREKIHATRLAFDELCRRNPFQAEIVRLKDVEDLTTNQIADLLIRDSRFAAEFDRNSTPYNHVDAELRKGRKFLKTRLSLHCPESSSSLRGGSENRRKHRHQDL